MADLREALAVIQEIYDKSEELADVDAAEDFVVSVQDKTMAIEDTIKKFQRASDKQLTALQNMAAGLDKWIGNRRD